MILRGIFQQNKTSEPQNVKREGRHRDNLSAGVFGKTKEMHQKQNKKKVHDKENTNSKTKYPITKEPHSLVIAAAATK